MWFAYLQIRKVSKFRHLKFSPIFDGKKILKEVPFTRCIYRQKPINPTGVTEVQSRPILACLTPAKMASQTVNSTAYIGLKNRWPTIRQTRNLIGYSRSFLFRLTCLTNWERIQGNDWLEKDRFYRVSLFKISVLIKWVMIKWLALGFFWSTDSSLGASPLATINQ